MGNASCSCDSDTSASCPHDEDRDRLDSDEEEERDSDAGDLWPSKRRRRSPPESTPPEETFKRPQYDGDSCDDSDNECEMVDFSETCNIVKTKRFYWTVCGFPNSDMVENEQGTLRSDNYFVAGMNNQFQFYFVMEALKKNNDTYFGLYLCVLGANQTEVSVTTKCFMLTYRQCRHRLPSVKGVKFPRKPGCRYLGCISKAEYIEDEHEQCVYMEEGDLSLEFRVWGRFKMRQPTFQELKNFAEDGQVRDVLLEVNGKEFRASKKLLMEQSPVFAKKLEKTKENGKIKISDIEPDVMKQLLIYINTRRVTKLFKYSKQLSAAADKYKLKNLKAICKRVID